MHFSLRDLTERVGVTQSAIYRHFKDLDDMSPTLCREGFDAFAETERQIMADSPDPSVRLRALVRAYIHFATSNPAYFRIMFDSGFATACVARAMLRDCAVVRRRAVDHGHDVFHQAFH
jgi:AcrR family transcriptional regulator